MIFTAMQTDRGKIVACGAVRQGRLRGCRVRPFPSRRKAADDLHPRQNLLICGFIYVKSFWMCEILDRKSLRKRDSICYHIRVL